jgi:hypothetical protein
MKSLITKNHESILTFETGTGRTKVFSSKRGRFIRNHRAVFCKLICADENYLQIIGKEPQIGLRLALYIWENKKWELVYITDEIIEIN